MCEQKGLIPQIFVKLSNKLPRARIFSGHCGMVQTIIFESNDKRRSRNYHEKALKRKTRLVLMRGRISAACYRPRRVGTARCSSFARTSGPGAWACGGLRQTDADCLAVSRMCRTSGACLLVQIAPELNFNKSTFDGSEQDVLDSILAHRYKNGIADFSSLLSCCKLESAHLSLNRWYDDAKVPGFRNNGRVSKLYRLCHTH